MLLLVVVVVWCSLLLPGVRWCCSLFAMCCLSSVVAIGVVVVVRCAVRLYVAACRGLFLVLFAVVV